MSRKYGLPITTDAMKPWARRGQIAVMDPEAPAEVGNKVALIVWNGDELAAHFGQLVLRSLGRVEIAVLNPPAVLTFEAERIAAVHRVVGVYTPAAVLQSFPPAPGKLR